MNSALIIGGFLMVLMGYVMVVVNSMGSMNFKKGIAGGLVMMCGAVVTVTGAMI